MLPCLISNLRKYYVIDIFIGWDWGVQPDSRVDCGDGAGVVIISKPMRWGTHSTL